VAARSLTERIERLEDGRLGDALALQRVSQTVKERLVPAIEQASRKVESLETLATELRATLATAKWLIRTLIAAVGLLGMERAARLAGWVN
jgi:hypothetical protein